MATWSPKRTDEVGALDADLVQVSPLTGGKFMDFRFAVEGVQVLANDPACPDWFDAVAVTANASLVYSVENLLSSLPGALKMTTNGGSGAVTCTHTSASYPPLTDHSGAFYFRLDTNPTANWRPVLWSQFGSSGTATYLRVNSSNRSIDILDTNTVKGSSHRTLSAATWYRCEWHYACGSPGTITIRIYEGDSTSIYDEFSATYNNGTYSLGVQYGIVNGVNLGGNYVRIAAIADACSTWPGPYPYSMDAFRIAASDQKYLCEIDSNGQIVQRAWGPFHLTDGGGLPHYLNQKGDPLIRICDRGILVGGNYNLGNPVDESQTKVYDVFIDAASRRVYMSSQNVWTIDDPPDINGRRQMMVPSALNQFFQFVDTAAVWTAGSPVVSVPNLALNLTMRGCGINLGGTAGGLDGTQFNIAEILSPTSCTVTPTPATSSAAGVAKITTYPYPQDLMGTEAGLLLMQLRWDQMNFPWNRDETVTTTTSGSATVTASGFTSDDINRYLLINDDPTLCARGMFKILNVVGTTLTLDATVGASLSGVPCTVCDSKYEGGAVDPADPQFTIVGQATKHCGALNSDGSKQTGAIKILFRSPDPNSPYTRNVSPELTWLTVDNADAITTPLPFGYDTGNAVVQQTNKSTGVTIDTPTGKITMNNAALNAGVSVSFTVTCAAVTIDDTVSVSMRSGGSADSYSFDVTAVADGSFRIQVHNITAATNLSEALVLNYTITRGASA